MPFKMKGFNKPTDPPMTPKGERKHRRKVHEYNKNVAKPLNETQKAKIEDKLSNMDPNDPEAKLLQDMRILDKNK